MLGGMELSSCSIARKKRALNHVADEEINQRRGNALPEFDPSKLNLRKVPAPVEKHGDRLGRVVGDRDD